MCANKVIDKLLVDMQVNIVCVRCKKKLWFSFFEFKVFFKGRLRIYAIVPKRSDQDLQFVNNKKRIQIHYSSKEGRIRIRNLSKNAISRSTIFPTGFIPIFQKGRIRIRNFSKRKRWIRIATHENNTLGQSSRDRAVVLLLSSEPSNYIFWRCK